MSVDLQAFKTLVDELGSATLVAVSKTKPVSDIQALYDAGQRDFGENYVQELVTKQRELPHDIRWHFIGHLQSNKARSIAPFVSWIHAVDSARLASVISKEAAAAGRVIDCLLQLHIAQEHTKFGFDETELKAALPQLRLLPGIRLRGLMGMATNTPDESQVLSEFAGLHRVFLESGAGIPGWDTISTGMSGDYRLALKEGSTMVRVGSLLFGARGTR